MQICVFSGKTNLFTLYLQTDLRMVTISMNNITDSAAEFKIRVFWKLKIAWND